MKYIYKYIFWYFAILGVNTIYALYQYFHGACSNDLDCFSIPMPVVGDLLAFGMFPLMGALIIITFDSITTQK